ncbi:MAG: DUF4349 domain-containing protein [Ktedonobacteraceae bacterium]|nr:DUF4349 domain-containing protein [Ktedonobacteraceae bacterium]
MSGKSKRRFRRSLPLMSIILFLLILAGCGGAASTSPTTAAPASGNINSSKDASGNAQGQQQQNQTTSSNGTKTSSSPQYLIKTLQVSMSVNDTRKAADDLQTWITATDPQATSAGMSYKQMDDNLYNITMSFSVEARFYIQIQQHLRDYPFTQKGSLLGLDEKVQDVSNEYVDNQSRLKNLRVEQSRLQGLLSQAQGLNEVLTLEQKLTDVEGQIETIEARINMLNSQTTFYTVTITLTPAVTTPPPKQPPTGWNPGQVFHDAFAASWGFLQWLFTLFIWLLAFAIYLVPVAVLVWFVRRWRVRAQPGAPSSLPKE